MSNRRIFTSVQEQRHYEMNESFHNLESVCNKHGFTIEKIKIIKQENMKENEANTETSPVDREMNDLELLINGIHFVEIPYPTYVIQGDEDKFPFLQSGVYGGVDPHSPNSNVHSPVYRVYKSIQVNGKFYAPIPEGGDK